MRDNDRVSATRHSRFTSHSATRGAFTVFATAADSPVIGVTLGRLACAVVSRSVASGDAHENETADGSGAFHGKKPASASASAITRAKALTSRSAAPGDSVTVRAVQTILPLATSVRLVAAT